MRPQRAGVAHDAGGRAELLFGERLEGVSDGLGAVGERGHSGPPCGRWPRHAIPPATGREEAQQPVPTLLHEGGTLVLRWRMPFVIENRPSDSPLATAIWRTESGDVATFLSVACATSSIVFTCQEGRTRVTVRGPETRVTKMDCPADAEFFGIELRLGTFMPGLPLPRLVDDLCDLPPSGGRSFWLDGAAWDI